MSLAALALAAAGLGGAAATYLFDDDMPLSARLAAGVPLGLAVWGLTGFALACVFGLGAVSIVLGLLPTAAALLVFRDPGRRGRLAGEARAALAGVRTDWAAIFFYMATAALVWLVTGRAVLWFADGGIGTGVDHNLGDLPFHVAIIGSFVFGENLPPEHPELAGVRLSYPFLVDFVAAMMVRAGASLRSALFLEGLLLAFCLVVLLRRWSWLLTGDRLASLAAPLLFLFNGGMGWTALFRDVDPQQGGLRGLLGHLQHDYTILPTGELRWGNVVTTLLVPQRTLLLGLPLALTASSLLWQALGRELESAEEAPAETRRARRLLAGAGAIAGVLPLVHGHSFAVVAAAGVCLALLFPRRPWAWFFVPAAALALPQVLWMALGSALRASSFLGWHPGWDHGDHGIVRFWLRNTGLFIPLLVLAFLWRVVPGRLARFYIPFALCFVVPNLLQLSPWIWDNIKFLVYWHVASVPIVALLLAAWWRRGAAWRAAALAAVALLTAAGALDVWRVVSRAESYAIFEPDAVTFAARMREATPPRALVLHVPTYRAPVFLAGRRSLLGYPGHIWSQGLDAGSREADIARIYGGGPDAADLLRRYGVDYVVYGPEEASVADERSLLLRYPEVARAGRYRLYDVQNR